ncbi:hypothetical protein [Micromonospora globbae]|uniref:hypothetical protein n=1 Tax=Micromonospora globbae TaxID=1894969 RepID=UPI003863366C|nr:hypothetical protein OH732_18430 [Micromonospora globbae]
MIVVQMFRIGDAADRAHAALLGEELVELLPPDAVRPPQGVLAIAAGPPLPGLARPSVVAGRVLLAQNSPRRFHSPQSRQRRRAALIIRSSGMSALTSYNH